MDGREKLIKIMQTEGLNAKQFAAEVGIQAGTISNIVNGRDNPSNDVIQKVLQRFENISADWMMLDRGPMYRTVPAPPVGEQTVPTLFDSLPAEPNNTQPATTEQQSVEKPSSSTSRASSVPSATTTPTISASAATLPNRPIETAGNADAANNTLPKQTVHDVFEQTTGVGTVPSVKQIVKIVVFYSDGTYENFCHS